MVEILVQFRNWLAAQNPVLPAVVLMLVIWLPQWLIRRYLPNVWEIPATLPFDKFGVPREKLVLLRKAWQAVPSIALAALVQALWTKGDPLAAVLGAAQGALAPVWHEIWKAVPFVPYRGGMPPAADPLPAKSDEKTPTY